MIKIIVQDEYGDHEVQSESDCITICDDGNGNITLIEDEPDDCDTSFCDDCYACLNEGLDYCIYEV